MNPSLSGPGGGGKIRCVIYDCDGVLLDSLEANRHFYNRFRTALGESPLNPEELMYAHTHTMQEAIRYIFRGREDLISRAFQLYSGMEAGDSFPYLRLEPNLVPALKALKEKGIVRAVNTSRTKSMVPILEYFQLQPYFDLVITALDVKNPKPHPESIERILQAFSLRKEETVLVGDSETDQKAAAASGVKFIAYKNREIPADAFIDDHLMILNLLEF